MFKIYCKTPDTELKKTYRVNPFPPPKWSCQWFWTILKQVIILWKKERLRESKINQKFKIMEYYKNPWEDIW